ncbi:hypothetical protein Tco_1120543 [Tanacetum coccineum]
MAALEFVDQHNMVACLEKTRGNSKFHEIVDFLTSSLIHHALTVSPTIYISYIEQFWNTASSKTVNNEKQIHATVDSKAVVVTEASIRNSLLLHDADGTACLTNEAIFQNLALMGKGVKFSGKVTLLFDFMLVPHQAPKGEGSEQPTEPQPTPSLTQPISGDQPPVTATSSIHATTQDFRDSLEGTNGSEGVQVQPSYDSPLSDGPTSDRAEGGMTLEELYVLCTNLSNRVLALKASKDAQAAEIIKLKTRIKKLKKKSHPGRKNAKPRPTLDVFDDLDADLAHGMEYIDIEEAVNKKGGSAATSIYDDEDVTMAQTLIKMKEEKSKEKGVAFKDVEDFSRPAGSILTLKPLPIIDPKDKGKGVLQEPKPTKNMAKSGFDAAQITRDAEIARQLEVDWQVEEERKRQREEEASKAAIAEMYDEVQAGIDVDALFAVKLQQEEREEYTIEERAKFLAETIAAQRKFRAA